MNAKNLLAIVCLGSLCVESAVAERSLAGVRPGSSDVGSNGPGGDAPSMGHGDKSGRIGDARKGHDRGPDVGSMGGSRDRGPGLGSGGDRPKDRRDRRQDRRDSPGGVLRGHKHAEAVGELLKDLAKIVKGGSISRDDVLEVMGMIRQAQEDGVITDEEKASVKAAVDALKDQIPPELMQEIQDDVAAIKANVQAKADAFWAKVEEKTSPEFVDAAQTVQGDLQEIRQGGYITRADLAPLVDQLKQAASDGQVTQEEKDALKSAFGALASQNIPAELLNQLQADVEALKAAADALPPKVSAR